MAIARSLDSIAGDIRTHHEQVKAAHGKALDHACAAGLVLVEAREQVPHGEWGLWLERNAPDVSDRTARVYMQIAEHWPQIESNRYAHTEMTIQAARKLIAKPKPKSSGEQNGSAAAESDPKTASTGSELAKSPGDQDAPTPPSADSTSDQDPANRGEEASEPAEQQDSGGGVAHDPGSIEAAHEGLDELKASAKATVKVARRVFQVQGQEIHAPWLGRFSWSGAVGQLNQYVRMLDDLRPVGGTPDKPVTQRDEKAKEAISK